MLETIAGVTIVGEAETADGAVEGILRMRPDSVLLDVQLLKGTGLDVLREVHPLEPDTVFIVLTNQPDARYRKLCLDAGADYFLDKSNEFEKAIELIAGLATRHGPHHIVSR